MAIDATAPRTRRAILGAALGGAGAIAVSALGRPEPALAATGDGVLLGKGSVAGENEADAVTLVRNTTAGEASLGGASATGTGVTGASEDATPTTDWSVESHKTGLSGTAGDITDVTPNTDETGVYGFASLSESSSGVWGDSASGAGVFATGPLGVYAWGGVGIVGHSPTTGTGVYGFTGNSAAPPPPAGVAVCARAASTSQTALSVTGKAKFSRSGRTRFGGSQKVKTISMAGVTTSSYIIATMQRNVAGVYVRAVVPASGSFKIYLSKAAGKRVFVGYLVIN